LYESALGVDVAEQNRILAVPVPVLVLVWMVELGECGLSAQAEWLHRRSHPTGTAFPVVLQARLHIYNELIKNRPH